MSAGKSIKNLYSTHILSPPNQQHIGIIVMAFQCWSCGVSWKLKSFFWKVEWIQFMTLWLVEMLVPSVSSRVAVHLEFVAADLVCHDNQKAVRQSFHFAKFWHAKFGTSRVVFPSNSEGIRLENGDFSMAWWIDERMRPYRSNKGESFMVVGNVIATDSSAFGFDVLTNTRVRRVGLEQNTCISYPKIQRCKGVAWRNMAVLSSRLMLVGCQGLSVEAKQITFSILPKNANLFAFSKIRVLHNFFYNRCMYH